MKKRILHYIFLLLLLTACGREKALSLPTPESLSEIVLTNEDGKEVARIRENDAIAAFLDLLGNDAKYHGESVNDQPTNVEDYDIVRFHHTDPEDESVAYLYESHGKVYMEQPYAGIWQLQPDALDRLIVENARSER